MTTEFNLNCSLTFPYETMTGAAGDFANIYGDIIETPQEFLYMAYLTCMGNVFAQRLTIASELRTQPRLFTILVGESAFDRKSTTLNIVVNHFKDVVDGFNCHYGIGSPEGLEKLLNKNLTAFIPTGTLLVFDEFKQFVNKCRIQASVLLPCVNTLFESNIWENATKTTHIDIQDAYLSILGATTIETYERIYDSEFIDIGFPNRVFIIPGTANKQHPVPQKLPDSDIQILKNNLVNILQHVAGGIELDFTPKAKTVYHTWYMDMKPSVHAKRLDTYSLRLMMLLAVNNLMNIIDAEIVKQAIAICNWQLEVRKIYDPIDADTKIAQMEEKIRRFLSQGMLSMRELKRRVSYNRFGIWYFDSALKNLQRHNEVMWNKKEQKWMIPEN
jgi:hypothetical protein